MTPPKSQTILLADPPHVALRVDWGEWYMSHEGRLVPTICLHGVSMDDPCEQCDAECDAAGRIRGPLPIAQSEPTPFETPLAPSDYATPPDADEAPSDPDAG